MQAYNALLPLNVRQFARLIHCQKGLLPVVRIAPSPPSDVCHPSRVRVQPNPHAALRHAPATADRLFTNLNFLVYLNIFSVLLVILRNARTALVLTLIVPIATWP